MPGITRPIDAEAAASADDALYEAHQNDRRPNPLFDLAGHRKKLSATDPSQESLRQEWRDYYSGALDDREAPRPENLEPQRRGHKRRSKSGKQGLQESSTPLGGNNNFAAVILDCRPLFSITIALRPKQYVNDPPEEWMPPVDDTLYAYTHFEADITDGYKDEHLDANGYIEYREIPEGRCAIRFPDFYDSARATIKKMVAGY